MNIRRLNPMSHTRSIFEYLELLSTCHDSILEEIWSFVKELPEILIKVFQIFIQKWRFPFENVDFLGMSFWLKMTILAEN